MQPTAHRASVTIAGTELTFETGRIARQAQGAVLARAGDNVVLAMVTAAATPKPGQDFFPLTSNTERSTRRRVAFRAGSCAAKAASPTTRSWSAG